ncbi:MAG TPA: phage tail tape measure protein [Fervidobacterium sp.]|nr:phage tail tape measure protein [Fervidobacterium sp.]
MSVVQDLIYRIGATNEGLKSVVRDSQQSIRGLMSTVDHGTQKLAQLSRRAMLAGSVLKGIILAVGKSTVDAASTFEKQMRRVQAVSQATASEYRELSSVALDLSTKTEHSAMAVAEGMNFMAMAGFKANEIMEAMPSVLQLASAGVMDLGTAADITTNILTGYGMEISELAHANDVLVSAMTGANVDLQMLGESFKYAGPLAKAAGIEFSETAAMIALMGNAGIQGSMAGTSLRQAITNLLNPTKQAQEVMDRLGVKTKDANGNLLSMTEILRQLEKSGASASDMMILFGQRAGPAMSALLGQGVDELEKFQQRLEDSEGLAARIEAMMIDTAEGQKQIFKNTVNAIRIMFGQDMVPYYRTAIFFLQGIADRIKRMEPEQRMQIVRIATISSLVVGLIAVLGLLGTAIAGIIKGFLSFGGAIMFLMSAKGLAIGAIILAVGLLKKAWDSDFGGIKTKTEEVWKVVGPILENFWGILQRSWAWAIDIAEDIWNWIFNTTWAEKWADIKGWLDATWNFAINIGKDVFDWVFNTSWADKWADIKSWLDDTWEWIINFGGNAWGWIKENLPGLAMTIEKIKDAIIGGWEWTINTAGDAWKWFKDSALVQWLDDLLQKITNSDAWQWTINVAFPAVVEGGKAVIKAVVEVGGRMYDAIKKGFATGNWADFWDIAEDIWSKGVLIGITLSATVKGISAVLNAITKGLGLAAAVGAGIGMEGILGLITVGIQLMEAQAEGSYEDFAKNVILAALTGVLVGLTFNKELGMLAFTIAINFKLGHGIETIGKEIGNWGQRANEQLGIPNTEVDLIPEYIEYRKRAFDESNLSWWDKFIGREPEGLLTYEEWKRVMGYATDPGERLLLQAIEEYAIKNSARVDSGIDGVKRLTGELSKLEKQALIVAETLKQGGTIEQALALLGIAYWETRGLGGYAHTNPTTGEVIRGGAGEYGIGQIMPGTGKDIWTRLWKQPEETWDESMLEDLDTNIAMMVSYFLDRYRVYEGNLRLAIESYNRGTAIDGMQAYTVGVVEWMEGKEGQTLADILYNGMENILKAMVQAGYDMDSDVRDMAAFIAQSIADYLVGESPPPKGPLSNIKVGMKNTMEAGIEGVEEGLLGGIRRISLSAQKIGEAAKTWGRDLISYFMEGVEEEALNQEARMEKIASRILLPITFDNPENDLWIFNSGVDLVQWFGKGISSAAQGVVEIVKMLMDKVFDAILKVIRERYPELIEFFNDLKAEVDEGIKAVEEFVAKLGGEDEGKKTLKELDALTTSWLQSLSNGLASAIVYGESLCDTFKNLLRMIAQQALSGLFMKGITSILLTAGYSIPTMHFGGLVMHSGGIIDGLRPDEVPIIAQKGERILSRKQNDQFEQMLEDLNDVGRQNINLNIYANDAKSFVDMVRRNPEAIISVLVDDYRGNGIMRRLVRG